MKKVLILIFGFFLLALLQTSFLVFFSFKGMVLNLILISVVLINIFESQKNKFGILAAFFGGFLLDIYSGTYFGLNVFFLLIISIFIKQFVKKYFQLVN